MVARVVHPVKLKRRMLGREGLALLSNTLEVNFMEAQLTMLCQPW